MAESAMDPLGMQLNGDGLEAALAGSDVIGIREWHRSGPPPIPGDGLLDLSQGQVVEQGHFGLPGELWWGRVAGGSIRCCTVGNPVSRVLNVDRQHSVNQGESLLLAVGQETSVRLAAGIVGIRQRMQFAKGEIVPWPAGAKRLQYSQEASTAMVEYDSSPIIPGSASKATLELSVPDALSGVLRFMLSFNGTEVPVSIPLKRDVDEAEAANSPHGIPGRPFRLRQGRLTKDSRVLDCHVIAGSKTLGDQCYFDDQAEAQSQHKFAEAQYAANAMFFGAQAEYLVVVFRAYVPSPDGSDKIFGALKGLLVMKRTAAL